MPETERIFAAFDVANIWKACRQEFGIKARIDFQVLSEMVRSKRHPAPVTQRLFAYLVTDERQKHHPFRQALRYMGYQIRERYMRNHKGLVKPLHTDWDVGITIDAIDQLETFDTFVLASGDGDFGLLLQYLKGKGKRTVVLTFESAVSRILYDTADELYILNRENISFTEENHG